MRPPNSLNFLFSSGDGDDLMPELPEVETIMKGLKPLVEGKTLQNIKIFDARCLNKACKELTTTLKNRKIIRVSRRGKFLCFSFTDGSHLTTHLGMTGKLLRQLEKKDKKHLKATLVFRENFVLYFVDPRVFGRMRIWSKEEALLPNLGPEPLDPQRVFKVLKSLKTTRPIKTVLLDQQVLAGIGNIYADEALFLARIHPQSSFLEIKAAALRRLSQELPRLLEQAIKNRGTTISDYQTPDAERGDHQHFLKVYGRENLPCYRCGTRISRIIVNGRSSHFCPLCQESFTT